MVILARHYQLEYFLWASQAFSNFSFLSLIISLAFSLLIPHSCILENIESHSDLLHGRQKSSGFGAAGLLCLLIRSRASPYYLVFWQNMKQMWWGGRLLFTHQQESFIYRNELKESKFMSFDVIINILIVNFFNLWQLNLQTVEFFHPKTLLFNFWWMCFMPLKFCHSN